MNNDTLRSSTISEIVNQWPGAIPVFEKLNIDYCCHGKLPLSEACQNAHVSEDEVLAALKSAPPTDTSNIRPQDWSLDLLTNYIVQNHHQYVKRAMPEIQSLADKVFVKHGTNHPALEEIRQQFRTLSQDLQNHMHNEEHVLFPLVNALVRESSRVLPVAEVSRSMSNLMPVVITMETEHQIAGNCLQRIRTASQHFTLPTDACTAFATLYRRLQEFEADLHIHIHLENNILFPKTLALEARQLNKPIYVN